MAITPTPPKKPYKRVSHGQERQDPYAWLEERENQAVIEYLKEENAYTEEFFKTFGSAEEDLYQELKARVIETDMSVPTQIGQYVYYMRTEEGRSYPFYCRKKIISKNEEGKEEIILDQNLLAHKKTYCDVGIVRISPNQNLLAFSVDYTGAEVYDLYIKNLATGELLPDVLFSIDGSAEWSEDGHYLFYTTYSESLRPYRLWRHQLGTPMSDDVLVYEEKNEELNIAIGKTRDHEFLTLCFYGSTDTVAVWVLSAHTPEKDFIGVCPFRGNVEYDLEHGSGYFYVRTNKDAIDFSLVRFPDREVFSEKAEVLIPPRAGVYLEGVDVFEKYIVLYEKEAGNERVVVREIDRGEEYSIPLPEVTGSLSPHGNPEFKTTVLRFSYTSFTSPTQVVDYDMSTRTWTTRKEESVPGYNRHLYRSERVYAPSSDGKSIPISLVYRADLRKDTPQPLFLCGYGAYGDGLSSYFSRNRLSLLDRGVIVALAHVRGGDELGRSWYFEGKGMQKKNSFNDFILCAEYLFQEGYSEKSKLVVSGASAGGLLVGAVIAKRPDICVGAVLDVPFVDVLNTMENPALPLTTIEYTEWGNPNNREVYEYMKSYAPYENIKNAVYPAIFTLASFSDRRVPYWEGAKWTARLREYNTGNAPILLKTELEAGHAGPSDRYAALRETAGQYLFILATLNLLGK